MKSIIKFWAGLVLMGGVQHTALAADMVQRFDCEAGDMSYRVEVKLSDYKFATVDVSVGEMMDQSLARQFKLDLIHLSPTVLYEGMDDKHGKLSLKGRSGEGGDLYVDGEKLDCTFSVEETGGTPKMSGDDKPQDKPKRPARRPDDLGINMAAKSYGGIFYDHPSARKGGVFDTRAGEAVIVIRDTRKRDRGYHWFEVKVRDQVGFMWGGDLCYDRQHIKYMDERCVGYSPKRLGNYKQTYGMKDPEADWLAIAVNDRGQYGIGRSVSRTDVGANALRTCGSKCKILEKTTKQCISFAQSTADKTKYGYGAWDDKNASIGQAASKCRMSGAPSGTCKIIESKCQ